MSERDPAVEAIVEVVHADWCPGSCDNPNLPLPNCEFRDDIRRAVEAGRELGRADKVEAQRVVAWEAGRAEGWSEAKAAIRARIAEMESEVFEGRENLDRACAQLEDRSLSLPAAAAGGGEATFADQRVTITEAGRDALRAARQEKGD